MLPERVSTVPDCVSTGSAVHVLVLAPVLLNEPVCSTTVTGVGILFSTIGGASTTLVLVGGNISNT